MAELYQKIILQHYKQPLNKGELKGGKVLKGANYFCGDKLTLYLKVDKKGKVLDVKWQGGGCVIAQASASIFSEMIKGKSINAIKKMSPEQFLKHLNITVSPMRAKCALLPLYVIKDQKIND